MSYKNHYKRPLLKSTRNHSQLKLPTVEKKLSHEVKAIPKIKSGKLPKHKVPEMLLSYPSSKVSSRNCTVGVPVS